MTAAISRLRRQEGFGLVELLIAMTVLSVGILAVVAGFGSGYVALNRATRVSSGSLLADKQMERFRALTYQWICLSSTSSEATYAAGAPTGTAVPTCSTTDSALVPIQDPKTGPDNRSYRVDTYVVWNCPIGGTLNTSAPDTPSAPGCRTGSTLISSPVKLVRVVVRDHTTTSTVYAREESTFDPRSSS
jgi:prepilin-type N-terminal cleavage/methylation domain-containing protein